MDKNLDFFFSKKTSNLERCKMTGLLSLSESVLEVVGRLHGYVKWEMVVRKVNPLQQT